ncbi:autotransporter-associated N-terminal domain-containing protein [Fusobacterium pseudoperiodonticum]|uniref:Autotransporter domain-containing protein n=1 Tax=Fusobacterium pseudoperiodonticum TaxID=2663009 RepID=A0AAD0AKS5_9FUSO|nr:autotransporter-associated N-terminal domain-containing protein [Fusobacterium pseudoperiodonticum]ATV36378.1 autotransporter domain-containing protein [Fusobacterium pseudoperiodonticum]ATV60717.1 autotransporter domain-containing protein [Fusobacterium pseudoperiodonticum]
MNRNLQKIEKDLRSIAKRYKSVKYSIGLVILFLMMGLNAFSEEVNTDQNVSNSVGTITTREGIRDSVEGLQGKIKDAKAQNTKSIESLRLELIQLMEQGGQVIKSPWASWQFGINYMYNNWSGTYKGSGDKPPKYFYNSIYRRGNWEERNAIDTIAGKSVDGNPITPGNENTNTWQTATTPTGVAKLKRDTSIDASTIGKREWGLVELRKIREPLNEVEIFANVSPKEVKKDKLDIPVSVTPPATLSAPVVKPNVNKPTEAPKVDLPTQPNLEIAQAPAINNDPEIKVLTVNKVGAITIDIPIVKPVDFILSAAELSTDASGRKFLNKPYSLNGQTIAVTQTYAPHPGDKKTGNYISTWGYVKNLGAIDTIVNVDVEDTRAFMVDEGIDVKNTKYDPFKYTGTINLNKSKNVGIDVQGTHTSYSSGAQVNLDSDITSGDTSYSKGTTYTNINTVANITVTNAGKIIGNGGTGIENQVAFGFNNFDASSNNTRTEMINEGTITLNAIKSVGIQLRPEDPNASGSRNDLGLNMMTGENKGDDATITLNGAGSFGILTVKNKKSNGTLAARKTYSNYGVTTSEGGQIASRAQEDYKSLVKNTGKIKIESDNSIGVGILNSIQSVEVGGTIDIGKGTLGTYGDITGGVSGKVDGAVGVYTEEATRPVKGRVYTYTTDANGVTTETMTKGGKDDHGLENTIAIETGETYTDSTGATKNKYRGQQVGTDTVEVSGTINLENNSTKSFGLRNSKTGSITLLGGGKVEVKGEKNFGALSNASAGKIDINHGAEIKGTGKESIGYAMLDGVGTNAGTIDVTGNNTPTPGATTYEGSLGFYGEKGTFNNVGTIKTKGNLAHAVVVKNPGMTFNHYGTIEVDSHAGTATDPGIPGNIGVFSDGDATVNFKDNSNVFVGKNSIGIYSEDKTKFNSTFKNHGTLNIKIGENSTFAYLNGNATTSLEKFFVKNADGKDVTVNIKEEMGENSSLVYADGGAKALLDGNYTITKGNVNPSTMALLAANASNVTVDSGKTLTTNTQVALAAVSGSTAENKGTIVSNRSDKGIGIYAKEAGSKGINKGTITMEEINAIGMYGKDVASLESSTGSNIKVKKTGSVGMYGVVSASATVPPFTVTNAGTIELEEGGSAGIYLVNDSKATDKIANLSASNTGTIKLKSGEGSIGIYAPKVTISDVRTITMENVVEKSIAAYISDGGKITNASTANINLGTSGKNIAYYVKNAGTSIGGANVGTVKGYGVGVYLEGTKANPTATPAVPASQATLGANAPELKFNNGTTDGNGIIGLYLKGDTDISAYTKTITVGNTVGTNSAIGIYSDAQGVSGTPYVIKANIKTGTKAVGIFSAPDKTAPVVANKSYIKYLGSQMDLGEGSTGFYVNGKTELDTTTTTTPTTTINLDGGLVAYVTKNSEFVGGNSKVNLSNPGIGVYGERGAKVDVGSWTFNNNGNAAEEIRLKEGIAKVTTPKSLKPKMVLTHVINGETYLTSTVTAVADAGHTQEENIGLMAQGIKNTKVGITWDKGTDYEIINEGTIDFTDSNKSTAIYAESARVKNDGTIKLGESSTGIYGIYRDDSPKFEDAGGTKYPNKLEIDTTANSKISLKNGSTGMYLVNAQRLDTAAGGTIQSVAGETNNVGIYAINGSVDVPTTGTPAEIAEANAYNNKNTNFKSLTMTNNSNITLGNGSVGIYTRGQSDTVRNTVTNDGNITVGDTLTGAPAVGIYAENTNLTQGNTGTPDITVGEKGIALYGKNSTITAKGTVNYSNKGILGYFENSIFTSHYGDLTAHQNTMLFLKNSTANMNGAGNDIDITVPDKAATSDSFAGVYVEGTSTLNGVKKITVGENSNGIFMKDATFTSNVTDIESTKEGAKGLLAVESDLTNNSKITLSGDSSIGIYSDASNAKTVTNNGKLTIAGKKTLGVFLKGSQTFINTADIDVADTTSSVPAEKTVGIYTKDGTSTIKHNSGTIDVGTKSIGIFSATNSGVEVDTPAKINVKDEAIGIYKEKGTALLKGEIDVAAHTSTTKNSEPVGLYGLNGANITDSASKITVGAKSFGFILENETTATTNQYTSTGAGTVSLGDDSVFLYSNGQASLTNGRDISSNSKRLIGFYIKGNGTNRGDLTNNVTIDFSNSLGSIGIYAPGGKATNNGRILVGDTDSIDPATGKTYTDVSKIIYGIGMAADNGGHIINNNEIRIYGDKSIGMYGKGVGTTVENNGTIFLDGSRATATNKIQSMIGVYVDEGAKFINYGDIRTADAYAGKDVGGTIKVNDNVSGLVGVAVMNGSTLENHGNIDIDANESYGVVIRGKSPTQPAVIKNYGNFRINVRGRGTYGVSYKDISAADLAALEAIVNSKLKSDATGQELVAAAGTDKSYEGVSITIQNGKPVFTRNGVPVSDSEVEKIEKIIGNATSNLGMSDVGFYIDTLGRTKPIDINGATPPINSQLIVGTEYSELTNKKEWFVKDDVIAPFLQQIQGRNFKLTSIAGSLTWMATPVLDNYGQIKGVAMTKLPYTAFVEKSHNAWNFADGLEQRYGMNALDSREKRVFNLLNSIGNNEEILLTQAYDEMMGHQYANVQQRIYETGNILNREFSYLRNAWSNPTKDANKVKVFGTNGEYKTDTAGIIDYKYNAQGVAYVHEDESVKLGETVGWYAGLVHNRYKFEDIGRSKEEMLQGKVGMFKSVPFDDNNSLNWTISGDVFVGYNKMHRRFLVVNEIFNAKSRYYSYGLGVKNELSKEFRLSEGFALKPYGALRLEYGRMSKIRERSGEVKLEVKSNDYISIKPEIGAELSYRAFFGPKSLKAAVTVAYENELGVLANPKNKARVAGTSADWFNIRGEKEDRRGNVKTDLNIGVDNQRIGVTANVGYDTKGSNIRGGLGLRVIF